MVDLVTIRKDQSLVPATKLDLERLERIRPGRPMATKVIFKRSVEHNRWYRALVGVVAEGIGLHPDTLHAELKLKAGFVQHILMSQAGPVVQLQSTAFAEMDEAKFTEYRVIAERLIFEHYLPEVRRKDVIAEVERLVGPRPK